MPEHQSSLAPHLISITIWLKNHPFTTIFVDIVEHINHPSQWAVRGCLVTFTLASCLLHLPCMEHSVSLLSILSYSPKSRCVYAESEGSLYIIISRELRELIAITATTHQHGRRSKATTVVGIAVASIRATVNITPISMSSRNANEISFSSNLSTKMGTIDGLELIS